MTMRQLLDVFDKEIQGHQAAIRRLQARKKEVLAVAQKRVPPCPAKKTPA